jgi:hypothetical protein
MATFTQEITTDNNDGYKWPGPFWNWYINTLQLGYPSPLNLDVNLAVRFTNITIPAGSTINSAKLSFKMWYQSTTDIHAKIYGMDQDNTAIFPASRQPADVPTDRTHTTAAVDWDRTDTIPSETYIDTSDISSVVQEIVDRAGWASGNAMGFIVENDGMASNTSVLFYDYDAYKGMYASGKYAVLTITYTEPAHQIYVPMNYRVRGVAQSISKDMNYRVDPILTENVPFQGIKVGKDGVDVTKTNDPHKLKFSSQFNTLKYYLTGTAKIQISASAFSNYSSSGYIEHNLNYYPFALVYAKSDLANDYLPLGFYQAGSGAYQQFYYYITTTRIYLVVEGWTTIDVEYGIDYYIKIFKNNLNL